MILKNKISVITGCNRGIGREILTKIANSGSDVYACVRKIDPEFEDFTKILEKKNNIFIKKIILDLSSSESIKDAANKIINDTSTIDILINNAGVVHTATYLMTPLSKLKSIFETNFFSQTLFTQMISKKMIKEKKGNILYITSTSGIDNEPGRGAYSASKTSLASQSIVLSKELGPFNIRVNSLAPGLTDTEMMRNNTKEEVIKNVISRTPLQRIGKMEEIANVALFLVSDESSFITGQEIRVDGGMY